jgi:hypothetical protein
MKGGTPPSVSGAGWYVGSGQLCNERAAKEKPPTPLFMRLWVCVYEVCAHA